MCSPPKPRAIRALLQATGANNAMTPRAMKQVPITGTTGTEPDILAFGNGFCVTKIELVNDSKAVVSTLNFGARPTVATPTVLNQLTLSV